MLALHLPNKLILPDALHFAQEAIASPDVHVRAAACTVIVDVAEGCSDALRKKLLPVLQVSLVPFCMAECMELGAACHLKELIRRPGKNAHMWLLHPPHAWLSLRTSHKWRDSISTMSF